MKQRLSLPYLLYFAWLIALFSMLGSLYFSEILHFVPCSLCWWERVCLFPLVLILGIASFRSDCRIIIYAFPLAMGGLFIALFHYLQQKGPAFLHMDFCDRYNPCTQDPLNLLNFITLPLLAAACFLCIAILLYVAAQIARRN